VSARTDAQGARRATFAGGREPEDAVLVHERAIAELDARIDALHRLRDNLTVCIGCGCLSLKTCYLHNVDDHMAVLGPGAPRLKPAAEGGVD
jgi:MerR family redox-sensitive transcriptional activator SoxR